MLEINKLKKGDYFKLNEKSKIIYVYDGYCRFAKKYTAFKFEDISDFREFKKGKMIFINFEF